MYKYGLIGNCQTAALVSESGSIDWLCLPRPDSPPVFGRILDSAGGYFSVESPEHSAVRQTYIHNTNVLTTTFKLQDGCEFQITDFCPRFYQHGMVYRPTTLFRIIEPRSGNPPIRVCCRPINGWEKSPISPTQESKSIQFNMDERHLQLTTNMPLTYLCEETLFNLEEPLYFALSWNSRIEEDIVQISRQYLQQTIRYWQTWVKHCSIPTLYQKETIRSALTLKLHCYEDTGAILAALTTSLPEENGLGRNWDYRYCWLRDAYFVLSAFHSLGQFEEMEGFLKFLLNVAERHEHSRDRLRPVYRLDQSLPLPETEHGNWEGFDRSQPIRSNNQAAEHIQNDVYGEMILTLAPIFFDERFHHLQTPDHENLIQNLVKFCIRNISQPDAGLWELRNGWQEHSFSNLMCWAGIERAMRIKKLGFLNNLDVDLSVARHNAERAIFSAVKEGTLRNGPNDESFDAALLLMPLLRFPSYPLCVETIQNISQKLQLGESSDLSPFLYRYLRKDDFGNPKSAFLICSFWLVQALARTGKADEAARIMQTTMTAANHLGLFSEHYIPLERKQAGNFPQAYSHVGQINAVFSISPPWDQIL